MADFLQLYRERWERGCSTGATGATAVLELVLQGKCDEWESEVREREKKVSDREYCRGGACACKGEIGLHTFRSLTTHHDHHNQDKEVESEWRLPGARRS